MTDEERRAKNREYMRRYIAKNHEAIIERRRLARRAAGAPERIKGKTKNPCGHVRHVSGCAECCRRAALRHYDNDDREAERRRCREWYSKNRESVLAAKRAILHSPQERARITLRNAVRGGRVIKATSCSRCAVILPSNMIHAHHHDYSKPLDVTWLCRACHGLIHRKYDGAPA